MVFFILLAWKVKSHHPNIILIVIFQLVVTSMG